MSEANDLVKKEDNLPSAVLADLQQLAGQGFEDTTADDYAIPYLSIAQALSPQLDETSDRYIPELKQGQLFDTVDNIPLEAVEIIPVFREHFHVEWVPRDAGGGFIERHPVSKGMLAQTTRNEKGRDMLPSGNEIIDTFYLYCLVVDGVGNTRPVVVSFSRTGVKKYKNLMSRARNIKLTGKNGKLFEAPLFSQVYPVDTVRETSGSGNKYYNWSFGNPSPVSSAELLQQAVSFRDAVASGSKGAAEPENEHEVSSAESSVEAF